MNELLGPNLNGNITTIKSDLSEIAEQTAHEAIGQLRFGRAWIEVQARRMVGKISQQLGLSREAEIKINNDILTTAVKRGIPNYASSYFCSEEGPIVDSEGYAILNRFDPERLTCEFDQIKEYVSKQPSRQLDLFEALLNDPNSDTKDYTYRAGIDRVNSRRITDMDPTCRVAITIPARYEGKRIRETLQGFAKQVGVSKAQYEINVLVNHRFNEEPDETTQEAMRFQQENPELKVNIIDVQFDENHANVGHARKLLVDFVLARAIQRGEYNAPLYIISADADETKIDPTIVKKVIEGFDNNPKIDCLRGRQDRSNALIAQNHLAALSYKSGQFVEMILRDTKLRNPYRKGYNFEWNRVVSGGWASAFTSEIYTTIGGYPEKAILGEDIAIGQLASIARGHWDESGNLVPFLETTKTMSVHGESNFLRLGYQLISGNNAYIPEEFSRQDIKQMSEVDILRSLKFFERLDSSNQVHQEKFKSIIYGAFGFLQHCVGDKEEFLRRYGPRFMLFMGFNRGDYSFNTNNDHVSVDIHNWTNIYNYLEKNRLKYAQEFKDTYGIDQV